MGGGAALPLSNPLGAPTTSALDQPTGRVPGAAAPPLAVAAERAGSCLERSDMSQRALAARCHWPRTLSYLCRGKPGRRRSLRRSEAMVRISDLDPTITGPLCIIRSNMALCSGDSSNHGANTCRSPDGNRSNMERLHRSIQHWDPNPARCWPPSRRHGALERFCDLRAYSAAPGRMRCLRVACCGS